MAPPRRQTRRPRRRTTEAPRWPFLRDVALFCGGLGGVANETLRENVDRPTLLLLFAAMMGLPAFFPKGA